MALVVSDCDCDRWDRIGAPVESIPGAEFGGILYFTSASAAARAFFANVRAGIELSMRHPDETFGPPRYWAVHLRGRHVLSVKDDGRRKVTLRRLIGQRLVAI